MLWVGKTRAGIRIDFSATGLHAKTANRELL